MAALQVAGWRAAYQDLVPAAVLAGLAVDERAGALAARMESAVVTVLLAEQQGELLGFGSVGASRDPDALEGVAELYALYVQPGRWRGGIGELVHAAALQTMSASGFAEATLWVLEGNARAQGFYADQGWRPDGARKVNVECGAELRYRRRLR